MEKIGYDLDGVLCEKGEIEGTYFKLNALERKAWQLARENHYKTAKCINKPKEKEFYIITSRKPEYEQITREWLEKHKIRPKKILFMKDRRNRGNMIAYKSRCIKNLGITKFYEDDPAIAKELTKKCKNTEIVLVKSKPKKISFKIFQKTFYT